MKHAKFGRLASGVIQSVDRVGIFLRLPLITLACMVKLLHQTKTRLRMGIYEERDLRNIAAGDRGMILGRPIENDSHGSLRIELFQIDGKVSF